MTYKELEKKYQSIINKAFPYLWCRLTAYEGYLSIKIDGELEYEELITLTDIFHNIKKDIRENIDHSGMREGYKSVPLNVVKVTNIPDLEK